MTLAEEVALWQAFAARIELRYPFLVDLIIEPCDRYGDDRDSRAQMRVRLHVLERDTREPITVDSRRPCAPWTTDQAALEMLFDLLEVALRHETYESVRIDGRIALDTHAWPGRAKHAFQDSPIEDICLQCGEASASSIHEVP